MPSIEINFECEVCGGNLKSDQTNNVFSITPCDVCMDIAKEEAHNAGYDEGYAEGELKV